MNLFLFYRIASESKFHGARDGACQFTVLFLLLNLLLHLQTPSMFFFLDFTKYLKQSIIRSLVIKIKYQNENKKLKGVKDEVW